MNRKNVIVEKLSFREFRRVKSGVPKKAQRIMAEEPDNLDIDMIVKFSKDKKTIKSDRKRKAITREMLMEYLDINYNIFDF